MGFGKQFYDPSVLEGFRRSIEAAKSFRESVAYLDSPAFKELKAIGQSWNHLLVPQSRRSTRCSMTISPRSKDSDEALSLHVEGRYFAAISLFLSQSEGIGRDIFGAFPISRNPHNLELLKAWVEPRIHHEGMFEEFWRSILRVLPINENTERLSAYEDPLNRHNVLHGKDLSYGNKKNSLKALAWIQYVASFTILDDSPVEQSSGTSST